MSTEQRLLTVSEAVASRIACRDFLDKEVSLDLIMKILNEARRAPSSSNLQPWKIYLINGQNKTKLTQIMHLKLDSGAIMDLPLQFKVTPGSSVPAPGFRNTLKEKFPKYYERSSKLGKSVYTSQGIKRGDFKARMDAALYRGYDFFGAPAVGLLTIDKRLTAKKVRGLGIMLQTIMLLCQQYGLSTCSLGVWSLQHKILRNVLSIGENELIFCGMAIGYKNESAPVNQFKRERMSLDEMVVIPKLNDMDIDNIKFESKWWFKLKMSLIIMRDNYLPINIQYIVPFLFVVCIAAVIYKGS